MLGVNPFFGWEGGGGGQSKEKFKIFGVLRMQSHNLYILRICTRSAPQNWKLCMFSTVKAPVFGTLNSVQAVTFKPDLSEPWWKYFKYCKSGIKHSQRINFREFHTKFSKHEFKNLQKYLQYSVCTFWTCIRRSCVMTMHVLMQMGNILENVWGPLCFCAAQLLVNYVCIIVWC